MKDIEDFLRENKPQVKEDPTFILQAQRRMEQVEGIKAEVDRQSHRGRIALIAALVTGLVIGIAATAIAFLYPVHPESVGDGLWQSARLFLQLNSAQHDVPDQEAECSARQQKEGREPGVGLVEAQGKGKDVSHNGKPAHQRKPDPIFVNIDFLFFQLFTGYLEMLFYPVPSAQPAQAEGGKRTQPVSKGCYSQAGPGTSRRN